MTGKRITRRAFVRGVGAALAAPAFIRSTAIGAAGRAAANDRIVMGTIGLGGRGRHVMGVLMGLGVL